MYILHEASSSDSPAAVPVTDPLYVQRHCAVHCERISISSVTLETFMYWHVGWEVMEVSSNFDLNIGAPLEKSANILMLLHNLSWDAPNQVLILEALKPVSSEEIEVITFRIPGATNMRMDFMSPLPKRQMRIECHDGREFTVVVQCNLQQRKEYSAARHRLPSSGNQNIFLPAA